MGSGFSKMKKQAKLMEEQLGKMQEELKNTEVIGSAGNGLVTITLSGDKKMKSISIKEDCVDKDDIEGLQDLIMAAFEDASSKVEENSSMPSLPFGF